MIIQKYLRLHHETKCGPVQVMWQEFMFDSSVWAGRHQSTSLKKLFTIDWNTVPNIALKRASTVFETTTSMDFASNLSGTSLIISLCARKHTRHDIPAPYMFILSMLGSAYPSNRDDFTGGPFSWSGSNATAVFNDFSSLCTTNFPGICTRRHSDTHYYAIRNAFNAGTCSQNLA